MLLEYFLFIKIHELISTNLCYGIYMYNTQFSLFLRGWGVGLPTPVNLIYQPPPPSPSFYSTTKSLDEVAKNNNWRMSSL